MNNKNDMDNPIKFFIPLRGDKEPKEYIRLAKLIERLGFDRIYVYDDLMFHSSSQILTLIAEHTENIEIGPCLVNGFYRHPAIIAQEAAFLEQLAPGRSVLGMGRGAFFDFYNMDYSEKHTRNGLLETVQQVNRLLVGDKTEKNGDLFQATSKAFLRVQKPERKVPTIIGSWNSDIANIANVYTDELQVAEVWDELSLMELKSKFNPLNLASKKFNIGGMSCISDNKNQAFEIAKKTVAVYIPYLFKLIEKDGYDLDSQTFKSIFEYSKKGEYEKCANLISDDLIHKLALVGTPEILAKRINSINNTVGIDGIMISPPYGTGTIEENLELIKDRVVDNVNSKVLMN